MEIPYTVTARPDTGLWNAKVGIWLFLASEVMLFGGLFSAYVFLRLDAPPGHWPHGLLNVPVGTMIEAASLPPLGDIENAIKARDSKALTAGSRSSKSAARRTGAPPLAATFIN